MSRDHRGFTLLEALVAMAIFSFIGVAAYTLLSSTGRLKESGDAGYAALAGLQLAFRQIDEDFSQFAPRAIAGKGRERGPALDAEPEDAVVAFTRAGWRNPLGLSRSGLQRVSWALDDEGRLVRHYRLSVDDDDPDEQRERVYVDGIEDFELRYLDDKGKWLGDWPPVSSPGDPPADAGTAAVKGVSRPEPVPRAVEVRISHARFGELNRVIPLR